MRRLIILLGALGVFSGIGCGDVTSATNPAKSPGRLRASISAPGRAEFMIHAITYGPGWSELESSSCHKLYAGSRDSTDWSAPVSPPLWVHMDKYDNVACAIGSGGGGDLLVGGNIGISAIGPDTSTSATIDADQTNYAYLTNIPIDGTTILLDASPWFWEGYEFLHWEVRRGDGTVYRDTNAHLERPGNTDEYEYYAVFKHPECYPFGC